MAKWSPSSGYLFVGVNVSQSPATVTANTKTVTLTARYFVSSDGYGHNFSSTLHATGAISADIPFSFSSPYNGSVTREIGSRSITVAVNGTKSYTFNASVGPIWNGGNPTVSYTHTVQVTGATSGGGGVTPATPIQGPSGPTNVKAVLIKGRPYVTWVNNDTSVKPVLAVGIERQGTDGKLVRVATLQGKPTSWTDNAAARNERYTYYVHTWNTVGVSDRIPAADPLYMPIDAPTGVNVKYSRDGGVYLTWVNRLGYEPVVLVKQGDTETEYGAGTKFVTLPAPTGEMSWGVALASPGKAQVSPYTQSNTLPPLQPPAAPTIVGPKETVAPTNIPLAWQHNSRDTSEQEKAEVRYRVIGGTSWETVSVGATQTTTLPLLAVGRWEWQVRTWGLFKPGEEPGASAWSNVANINVDTPPSVLLGFAVLGAPIVKTSRLNLTWRFITTSGATQVAAEGKLYDTNGNLVETQTSETADAKLQFATPLPNGSRWRVALRAKSSAGLWSNVAEAAFQVEYATPLAPVAAGKWDETNGCVNLTISNPQPTNADNVAAVTNTVWCSRDGGNTWEVLAALVPLDTTYTDYTALSNGDTLYRVEAISDLPSSAHTDYVVSADSQAIWVSDGASPGVAFPWEPKHTLKAGLVNRKVQRFAGRDKGVLFAGREYERSISVTADVRDEEYQSLIDLEKLALTPQVMLYRDPMGRRMWVSLGEISLPRDVNGAWNISFDVTEVEAPHGH
jgi:hypothetical protein